MEIQDEKPEITIPLECIGFKGIRRRLTIISTDKIALDVSLDVCISIRGDRRGAHLSRNLDAILEVIQSEKVAESIEAYLDSIADKLLELHEYAIRSIVKARTIYYTKINYNGFESEEPVDVEVEVIRSRDSTRWKLRVGIYGMTVCPSAQEKIKEIMKLSDIAPSHSQKAYLRVTVESRRGRVLRIEKLSSRIAGAFSAPAISLLKRIPEALLVIQAHRNPRFAEDVVRQAIAETAILLVEEGYDKNTVIEAELESYESIHPHNVYVRARLSLEEALSAFSGGLTGISTKSIDS